MTTLCEADRSILLVIDPQARLMPAIHDSADVIQRCMQLAMAARELSIPVIGTEQNPEGLGPNVAELRTLCDRTVIKFHFAAVDEPGFVASLPAGRTSFVVAGCEAHVCVLQTAIRLLETGHAVKWVVDAVGSRRVTDRDAATARARICGADVVTSEMVLFEWLRTSHHPSFRTVLKWLR
ncbi:MAG: isochorismatase family protein [Caldimonas sp.]